MNLRLLTFVIGISCVASCASSDKRDASRPLPADYGQPGFNRNLTGWVDPQNYRWYELQRMPLAKYIGDPCTQLNSNPNKDDYVVPQFQTDAQAVAAAQALATSPLYQSATTVEYFDRDTSQNVQVKVIPFAGGPDGGATRAAYIFQTQDGRFKVEHAVLIEQPIMVFCRNRKPEAR
jgi:hypothetical protein